MKKRFGIISDEIRGNIKGMFRQTLEGLYNFTINGQKYIGYDFVEMYTVCQFAGCTF